MRISDLFEMTTADAIQVFRDNKVEPTGLSPRDLRQAYLGLAKLHHPKANLGDTTANDILKKINAAYDVLKAGVGAPEQPRRPAYEPSHSHYSGGRGRYAYSAASREETPWAWAGYSGGLPPSANIADNDYTDVNYIKKRMWELSGHSNREWTIIGYDGTFFRMSTSVFGSPAIFREMAKAMIVWQTQGGNPYECRAVFVKNKTDRNLYLIYADGMFYADNPIPFEFSGSWINDEKLRRSLPSRLDALKGDLEGPDAI